MRDILTCRVEDVSVYRLKLLRAACACSTVIAILSAAAAWRIADWQMAIAALLFGILTTGVFGIAERRLQRPVEPK